MTNLKQISQDKAQADFERPEYVRQQPRWERVDALLEVDYDINKHPQSDKYLTAMPAEASEIYEDRKERAYLWPALSESISGMVGILTSKGFSVDNIKNDQLREEILTPLKGEGSLGRAINLLAETACAKGVAYILVSPGSAVNASKAEDLKNSRKVKWSIYGPESIINWSVSDAGQTGDPRFADFIVLKQVKEMPDGDFGYEVVEEYLKMTKEGTQKYIKRSQDEEPVKVGEMIPHLDGKGKPLGFIPLIAFYYKYDEPFKSVPPLNALARMNVAHYNCTSNSDLAIRQAQYVIPVFTGVTKKMAKEMGNIKTGPTLGVVVPKGGDFKIVETTGRSLDVGLKQIEAIERKSNLISFKELIPDPNISRDVSATESGNKDKDKLSPLGRAGINLEDAVTLAILVHAAYINVPYDPAQEKLKLAFDPNKTSLSSDEVRAIIELVQNSIITREMAYEAVANGEIISNTVPFKSIENQLNDDLMEID